MKRDIRIKKYGAYEKGTIIFFLGRQKYRRYYSSILHELANNGYLVLAVPYLLNKQASNIKNTMEELKIDNDHVILMSHAEGDEKIYSYFRTTEYIVDKIIISSPSRNAYHRKDTPTLVLWSNRYRATTALDLFVFVKKRKNYHFIGYPNCSRYLFAGVGYSQYHDDYEKKTKKIIFDFDKYYRVDEEILDDLVLFLNENRIKEKIAIFSENYLPFNSGVNILTNVLKTELEKEGKKVYPVTLKLKGVDYNSINQEKNVVVFGSHSLPGKQAAKEALQVSFRFAHMMKHLRAYQFDYIQLQTEFTIGIAGMLLRKTDGVPMVYTSHTMWDDMMDKRFSKSFAKIAKFAINKFLIPPLKYADLMTVPTQKVKDYYMQTWNKKEPIVVIPGCVDGQNFMMNDEDYEQLNKLKDYYQLKDKVVIGFIGRISKEKSIDQVIDYFERFAPEMDNLVLMFVGDGPYTYQLLQHIRNSKFSNRIIFVGEVANNKLKLYYRLFNAFCTASTFETQGLTYVESMWCHTPILARYDHCLDHFLNSGVNGLTFTDYESWKEGLLKIINDKQLVESIKEEGYKTALTYAKETWAKKMYYLYTQAKLFREGKIKEFDYQTFKNIK